MTPPAIAVYALAALLSGSLPTAYLVGRARGTDIRKHGSGNVGATNAFRVFGKGPGILVFAVDFLKGYLPVFAFLRAGGGADAGVWIGLVAVLGHVFTPFLSFKGGKGVATGAGVLTASHPLLFAAGMAAWLGCFLATKIVSLSSLVALLAVNLFSYVTSAGPAARAGFFLIFILIAWTHRDNIRRLRVGEEKRIG